jgi:tripartite-type tricarboxylate transporter receptor subunit TctC
LKKLPEEIEMSFISRRGFVSGGLALGAGGLLLPDSVRAQAAFPSKPISFVCAFPPGSGADVQVRYFADKVARAANATVVVENKAGAAGNIAAQFVARSAPDGHTVFVHAGSTAAANMSLFKNPPVDVAKELKVVATISAQAFMVAVRADSPYKTIQELTAAMKQKGAKASYATTATPGKVMGELYKQLTGVQAVEVNYRTGPDTINDMMSGAVDYGMFDAVHAMAQVREGRFRVLAVGTKDRMGAVPEIPTLTESGIDVDLLVWWAAMVPTRTPQPAVDKLNAWFDAVVKSDETKQFLAGFGMDPMVRTPQQGQDMLVKAVDQWADFVRRADIPPH